MDLWDLLDSISRRFARQHSLIFVTKFKYQMPSLQKFSDLILVVQNASSCCQGSLGDRSSTLPRSKGFCPGGMLPYANGVSFPSFRANSLHSPSFPPSHWSTFLKFLKITKSHHSSKISNPIFFFRHRWTVGACPRLTADKEQLLAAHARELRTSQARVRPNPRRCRCFPPIFMWLAIFAEGSRTTHRKENNFSSF